MPFCTQRTNNSGSGFGPANPPTSCPMFPRPDSPSPSPCPASIRAINNILYGPDTLNPADRPTAASRPDGQIPGTYENNPRVRLDEFNNPENYDYTLKPGSRLRNTAIKPGLANKFPLTPDLQYRHPMQVIELQKPMSHPGAIQSDAGGKQ